MYDASYMNVTCKCIVVEEILSEAIMGLSHRHCIHVTLANFEA